MKTLMGVMLIVLVAVGVAYPATVRVTFEWDANTEADLSGYRLYKSNATGVYTFGAGSAAVTFDKVTTGAADVSGNEGQKFYFVLTAFDTAGNESGPSNEVFYTIPDTTPPAAPKNFLARLFQVIMSWFKGGLSISG